MANTTCDNCGSVLGEKDKKYTLGGKKLCDVCMGKNVEAGNTCPCCKTHIPSDAHEVGLVLTPPGSGMLKKARSVDVLAIVCPNCKVLFFDDLTYKTLETLKK